MKHLILLTGFLLLSNLFKAQSAQYQWGFKLGSTQAFTERPSAIITDSYGNFFTTGFYTDTADFNPGVGANNLQGISRECYLAKYSSAGSLLWAKNIGMTYIQEGQALAISNGQLILTGSYSNGQTDLDPGAGTELTPLIYSHGAFMSKFDTSGNFIWGKSFPSFSASSIKTVKIDANNNIVIGGSFQYTVDLDPSAATATIAASATDGFVAKYDSNGNYIWGFKIGSTQNDLVNDLTIDANNNIYCVGSYIYTVNVNPLGTAVNLNTGGFASSNVFLAKYGSNGILKWANQIGSSSIDAPSSIKLDSQGNIVYAGTFGGVVDFDPSPSNSSITSSGTSDIFISKIDTANNFVWALRYGSPSSPDGIGQIAIDNADNIIATGMMNPSINFHPTGTYNVSGKGGSDSYLAKYSSSGLLVWAYPIGGSGSDWGMAVDVFKGDNTIYTTGYFNSTNLDLDISSTSNTTITVNGGDDIFIAKYNQCEIVPPPTSTTPLANLTVCPGSTTNLSATATGTVNWYYSLTPLGTGSSITTITLTSPGTYTWTADNTTSCGTSLKAAIVVTVNPKPTVQFSAPSYSTCLNQPVTIIATGADSYTWAPGGMTTASVVVTPTVSGSVPYTVIGTNSLGCTDSRIVYVSVQSPAIYTLQTTPSNSICLGQSLGLNVVGGAYTYTWSTGVNTASINATPTVNTTYSVIVSNGTGCLKTSSVNIAVNTASVAITGNTLACANATTALTASGANTYTWSTGATSSSITVSPIATSIYSVTATSVSGCTATAVKTISVNPIPFLNIVSSSPSLCSGTTATLTASGANTYTWNTSATTNTILVSPLINTTYSVQGSNLFGCVNSTVITQSVIASPTVSVNSGAVCAGQSFTMIPSGASTYSYSSGSNVVTPIVNANYTVTGIGANGCASANAAISSVTVNLLPTISVLSGAICSGQSFTMNPSGASTYTYSSGGAIVSPTTNTNYTITGTSAEGCVGTGNTICSVQVYALPNILTATSNTLLCTGQTATLTTTGANTYTWSTTENTTSIAVSPTIQTTYTVIGTDANGCSNSSIVTQSVSLCTAISQLINESSVFVFPNPFADVITIRNSFENYNIIIVDVLGKVVFEKQIVSTETNIDLSELKTGFYHLVVKGDGSSYTQKIIKQ